MFVMPDDLDHNTRHFFSQLYDQYYKLVYYVALKILKDHLAAEDILQETFSRALPYYDTLKNMDPSKQKSYLCTIARHCALDYIEKTPPEVSIEDHMPSAAPIADATLQQLINNEGYQHLLNYIQHLRPIYRDVLMLKYVHGYSNGEIADILHLKKKTVEMRLLRGKEALKNCLEKGSEQDD